MVHKSSNPTPVTPSVTGTKYLDNQKAVYGTGSDAAVYYDGTDLVVESQNVGSGALSLADGQLKFPATQNASANANTLDDYEEGTFTPTIDVGTPGTGVTYSVQVGSYTKIGRLVHIQGRVTTSSLGGGSDNIRLTGLPFTSDATANNFAAITIGHATGLAITASVNLSALVGINEAAATIYTWDATTGVSALQASEMTDDGSFTFGGTYHV